MDVSNSLKVAKSETYQKKCPEPSLLGRVTHGWLPGKEVV